MKRSKRQIDEWAEQLATTGSDSPELEGDVVAAFVGELRADVLAAETVTYADETMPVVLAAHVRDVAEAAPTGHPSGRVVQPLTIGWRRRAMISTFLSTLLGKLALGGTAIALATGGLTVTGNLPDPAQQWASDKLPDIGIEIPAPEGEAPDEPGEERVAPELPDDTSDTAKSVTGTVFEGDPADGAAFGTDVAGSATGELKDEATVGLEKAQDAITGDGENSVPDGVPPVDLDGATPPVDIDIEEYLDDALKKAEDGTGNAGAADGYRP